MLPVLALIAATTALLLPCCVCLPTAQQPSATAQTGIFAVASRTGTEAIRAKIIVDDYFKKSDKDVSVTATCSELLIDSILLPYPQNVPSFNSTVNSMVNVSANLHYLLYMYSHVLGIIYQSNTNHTQQLEQLDLLEMVFYRLSNQIQRYLQAHSFSSGYTKCIVHQEIAETVQNMNVILCHLREVAKRILDVIGKAIGRENIAIYDYQLCRSVEHVHCTIRAEQYEYVG